MGGSRTFRQPVSETKCRLTEMWAKGAGSPRHELAVGCASGALGEDRHRVDTTKRRKHGLDGTKDSTSPTPRTWLQHRRLVVAAHRRGGTIFRVDFDTGSASCATRGWSAAESSAVSSCRDGTTGNGRDVTRCSPPRRLCFGVRARLAILGRGWGRGGRRSVAGTDRAKIRAGRPGNWKRHWRNRTTSTTRAAVGGHKPPQAE